MVRKLTFAIIATASLGAAALAPTSALAWGGWHGGGFHRGFHGGWGGGYRVYGGYGGWGGGRGWCFYHPYRCGL